MEYNRALKIAESIITRLQPHCERIKIAGSLRRQKQDVHDIEIVCIPKKISVKEGLWEWKEYNCEGFVKAVNSYLHIKGDALTGKYMQRGFSLGVGNDNVINLDIFTATPENWGFIYAIRTGSDRYSKRLVTQAKRFGYAMKDGTVYDLQRKPLRIEQEKDFFKICREKWIDPQYRVA